MTATRTKPWRVLALIAARSGSKGLRHKNIARIGGEPLLARAVRLALQSQRKGEAWHVVVSTDSRHYARIARAAGACVPFLRPKDLAADQSRLIDVCLHALAQLDNAASPIDALLLLSATTPLTTVQDVRRAIRLFREDHGASVVSVRPDPFHESWRFGLDAGVLQARGRPKRVARRQTGPAGVVLNGAIYLATPAWLRRYRQFVRPGKTRALWMPAERSIDIESRLDLDFAEWCWQHRGR
jgi:CMP-N-acetylneuraminic acid synthetase